MQISIEDVALILRDKQELLHYISEQRALLAKEHGSLMANDIRSELYLQLSLSGKPLNQMQVQTSKQNKDLFTIIDDAEKAKRKQLEDYIKDLNRLEELEIKMSRLWLCFQSSSPKSFFILNRLYIKKDKWDSVIKDMKISKSTLKKLRLNALKEVQYLYISDMKEDEIVIRERIFDSSINKKFKDVKSIKGQINIGDFLKQTSEGE